MEQAENALDALEGLAVQDPECRKQFQTLLSDSKNYSPAWENEEAALSRVRMYELSGEFAAAGGLLKYQIYWLRDAGADHNINEAQGLLERTRPEGR